MSRGGEKAAIATAAAVRVWLRATPLGGVESLIEHRASMEGEGRPCPPGMLLRLMNDRALLRSQIVSAQGRRRGLACSGLSFRSRGYSQFLPHSVQLLEAQACTSSSNDTRGAEAASEPP